MRYNVKLISTYAIRSILRSLIKNNDKFYHFWITPELLQAIIIYTYIENSVCDMAYEDSTKEYIKYIYPLEKWNYETLVKFSHKNLKLAFQLNKRFYTDQYRTLINKTLENLQYKLTKQMQFFREENSSDEEDSSDDEDLERFNTLEGLDIKKVKKAIIL